MTATSPTVENFQRLAAHNRRAASIMLAQAITASAFILIAIFTRPSAATIALTSIPSLIAIGGAAYFTICYIRNTLAANTLKRTTK